MNAVGRPGPCNLSLAHHMSHYLADNLRDVTEKRAAVEKFMDFVTVGSKRNCTRESLTTYVMRKLRSSD